MRTARTRARQRLVGALVLLVVGVITFPLLFETQPRPLAADTPIKLSQRDTGVVRGQAQAAPDKAAAAVPPPALPADAGVEAPAAGAALPAPSTAPAPVPAPPATASRPAAASPAPPAASLPRAVPKPEPKAEMKPDTKPEPKAEVKPPPKPAAEPQVAAATAAPPSAAASGRFVVQVGAFSDARTLREARQKVEGLGLKTYTQVIDSSAGQRTRVRVGPFDSRSEAEAAAKAIKGGGMPAAILAL